MIIINLEMNSLLLTFHTSHQASLNSLQLLFSCSHCSLWMNVIFLLKSWDSSRIYFLSVVDRIVHLVRVRIHCPYAATSGVDGQIPSFNLSLNCCTFQLLDHDEGKFPGTLIHYWAQRLASGNFLWTFQLYPIGVFLIPHCV